MKVASDAYFPLGTEETDLLVEEGILAPSLQIWWGHYLPPQVPEGRGGEANTAAVGEAASPC